MTILLNEKEEETLKKYLLNFIARVSSPNTERCTEEIKILPAIIQLFGRPISS